VNRKRQSYSITFDFIAGMIDMFKNKKKTPEKTMVSRRSTRERSTRRSASKKSKKRNSSRSRKRSSSKRSKRPSTKRRRRRRGSKKSVAKVRAGKKNKWIKAVNKARKELNIQGFQPIKKGTPFYKLAKKYHNASK
jgi:hypothetical protein